MNNISILMSQRQSYMDRIANISNLIDAKEQSYDSLLQFKSLIMRSQNDFHIMNGNLKKKLNDLDTTKKDSDVTKVYLDGMNNCIGEIDEQMDGKGYAILLEQISHKLLQYSHNINDFEEEKQMYYAKIDDIDKQILVLEAEGENLHISPAVICQDRK